MKAWIVTITAVLALAGCAANKNWSATGGSRADATVRLSYEYGAFEVPKVNEMEAQNLAAARCKTWGYTGAEAFGGQTQQCSMPGGMGGCSRFQVTKEYQCTGNGGGTPTGTIIQGTN
jgi:hypothetical protein